MNFATIRRLGRPLRRSLNWLSRRERFLSSKAPVWYRMKDGFWMRLDPDQPVDREMVRHGGVWEPALRELIRCCVRSGDALIDIGAHKGWVTCLAAKQVGPAGRVISIDPDPRAFSVLSENIGRNGFAQVSAFPLAVGRGDGVIDLCLTRTLGNTSAFPNYIAASEVVEKIRVECMALDRLMSTLDMGVHDIPLIKIDAEGSEPLIWQGMQETLARYKPLVVMEINYASLETAGFGVEEFKRALKEAGYGTCFQISYEILPRGRGRLRLEQTDIVRQGELLIDILAVPNLSGRMKVLEPFIAR